MNSSQELCEIKTQTHRGFVMGYGSYKGFRPKTVELQDGKALAKSEAARFHHED